MKFLERKRVLLNNPWWSMSEGEVVQMVAGDNSVIFFGGGQSHDK